eukprot:tig00000581_g2227.t1
MAPAAAGRSHGHDGTGAGETTASPGLYGASGPAAGQAVQGHRRSVMSMAGAVSVAGGFSEAATTAVGGAGAAGEHRLHAVERSIHALLFALTDRTANGKLGSAA